MASTIKEFLIGLGFKVDDATYKKYVAAVASATEHATQLGAAVITTASAIGVHVERVTREFENYARIAERTNVHAVTAFAFGARQIGVSTDEAIGSIESWAQTMRTQPGIQGMVGLFGVKPGDAANKQMRDFVAGLKRNFGEEQYFAASMFAARANMNERTFRQYWMHGERMAEEEAKANRRLKEAGIDPVKANAAFLKYAGLLNTLGENASNTGTRVATDFLPKVEEAATTINDWLEGFNKYNEGAGGGPGMVATTLGGLFAGQWATNLLAKFGMPMGGLASSAMPWLAKMGLIGAIPLLASTGGANAKEKDIYRPHPFTGKPVLSMYGEQVIGAEKGTRESPLTEQAVATFASLKSSTDKLNDILSSNRLGEPNWLKSGLLNVDIPSVSPGKKFYTDEERKKDMRLSYIDDPPPLATKAWPATGGTSQSVTIDARTTINFQGSATPEATASLQRGLEAHAANILRNFRAATVPGNGISTTK